MNASESATRSNRWVFYLAVAFAIVWFATLGHRKLFNPDEGRYAEIPREMLVSGDWLTPRLNDLKYFEKPPLQYWTTAIAYKIFGVNEFASRFWCGLTGLLGVAFAGFAGTRLFGRTAGTIAAALLGCSLMYVALGHLNTLDMGLCFLLEAAMFAFLLAQRAPTQSKSERNWMLLAWSAAAFAFLTKGLEALVLPGLTLVAYTAVTREWSSWRRLHVLAGGAVFIVIVAPWFIAMSIVNPEFPYFFFIHEHVQRFLTDVHERVEPWWYFIPLLIAGALPWVSFAAHGLREMWDRDGGEDWPFQSRRFLLIWVAATMVFFSASHSKLAPYILPVMPALAILTGDFIARAKATVIRAHLLGIAILWLIALGYLLLGPLPTKRDTPPELFVTLFHWAEVCAVLAFAASAGGWWLAGRTRTSAAVVVAACGAFLGLSVLLWGFDAARTIRSGYDLARAIRPHNDPVKPFYSIHGYDQSLPFYLARTVTLVGYRGELDFGLTQEPQKWLPDTAAFMSKWNNDPSGSIAVMKHDVYSQLQAQKIAMSEIGRNIEFVAVVKP